MLDIKIVNGEVLDGGGSPATRRDVGIVGDRISALGDLSGAEARAVLDATGRLVCPGFIDAHSHSDAFLLIEPSAPSKIFQGITTEVVGNCGASAAPRAGDYRLPSDWADKEYPGSWSSVAEYRELIGRTQPAVNVAMLIGHGALRAAVAGYAGRRVDGAELGRMAKLLEKSLDEGGRGLSAGLVYSPGMDADTEELAALAKVVSKYDGVYASHMRSEGFRLLEAIQEAIRIGRDGGVRTQISHLKTSGRDNWPLLEPALDIIRGARAGGFYVNADRYPYVSSCTELDIIFPHWAAEGGRDAVLARLSNASDRDRLKRDLEASRPTDRWGDITIGSTSDPDNTRFRGIALPEVAESLGLSPVDAVLYLADTDKLRTTAFFSGMSEANMWTILAEPYVMLGTDASLRAPTGVLGLDHPHPRAYGSFPRFLRASLDGKTVPLPEAVRKMTSLPAEQFGLKGRGAIAAGAFADVVTFDPRTVCDTATYANPHQFARGVEHVIVNGRLTVAEGRLTGKRAGRFL